MSEITRIITILLKIILSACMINKAILNNSIEEYTTFLVYLSTFGFYLVTEYITDKYIHILFDLNNLSFYINMVVTSFIFSI